MFSLTSGSFEVTETYIFWCSKGQLHHVPPLCYHWNECWSFFCHSLMLFCMFSF